MNTITRAGLPDRLRALAKDEIAGGKPVLFPGNSHDLLTAADEIERLRRAIRRIAEQDATLSVCEGNVTVDMGATLTDAERVVRLPALDPNGAPGWNAAIAAVREALADAGVDWDTE